MYFGEAVPIWQIIKLRWTILPVAFGVSLIATPLFRRLALRFNIVDYPDAKVKNHARPTAYLGGLGILAGVLAGIIYGIWLRHAFPILHLNYNDRYPNWVLLLAIACGAIIATLVGLLDDIYDLRPWQKSLGQALSAAILIAVGVRPDFNSVLPAAYQLPHDLNVVLGSGVTLLFILGATNSINLLDGLDGLCAGVSTIITLAFMILALSLMTWGHSQSRDAVRVILCISLVGGSLGFLPSNRHPAKIFMGDAGSLLLGYISGTLMIMFMDTIGSWSIAAITIFGLPSLDTSVAIVRRLLHHQPLFRSDRGHLYDQLRDRGWTVPQTVIICYHAAALFAVLGLLIYICRFRLAVGLFVIIVLSAAYLVVRGGFLRDVPKKQAPADPPPTSAPADKS